MDRYTLRITLLTGVVALATASTVCGQVTVTQTDDQVVIHNRFISRSFNISNHHLLPGKWINERTGNEGTTFVPGEGSEEFALHPCVKAILPKAMPRKGWTATANSETKDGKSGSAQSLVDGDPATIWHSNYGNGTGVQKFPFTLQFDLGKVQTFHSFGYLPRQVGNNGNLKGFEFYASNSLKTLGTPNTLVYKGNLDLNGSDEAWQNLPRQVKARYVMLVETSAQNGYAFGSGAEFYLSNDTVNVDADVIQASALTLSNVKIETDGNTKRVTFDMAPYRFKGVDWDIDMVVELNENAHYLYKYLKVSVPESERQTARIDYIDMERMNVKNASFTWTHPEMGSGVGGMSGYLISLGQPVYIDGMFLGTEFPETDNSINDGIARVRYYSGKSLQELENEGRLTDGAFTTWRGVLGASRSVSDMDVIRSDFFAYLDKIIRPTNLRIQYNSWYDWMMDITDQNIIKSFKEMERGLTQNGVRPIDSYVIDDGWNAYGPYEKENKDNFWQFNSKFPNGPAVPADFAHSVSSNFGMWLGPRGGYNYNGSFARFLEEKGNGTYNRNNDDIATGDKVYLEHLQNFFLKQMHTYGVNYWKLDGFCAAVPQPSKNDRYISGGTNGIYYMTEHMERWAKVLSTMYADAGQRKSDLWINLTCYVNPSPWLLQWCNSVWMQISADMGRIKVDGRDVELDRLLNYRADRYFDFVKTREFQFPLSHIFNHDPTYGKTGCVEPNSMNDDEFRVYLYMMATRGTAFWEMLYSYNLLDEGEKWQVNAEALNFLQGHYDILRHAKLIGQTPARGNVYGYSCWNDREGIVSLRNPKNTPQTYTLKLDRTIGVPESAKALSRELVVKYNHKGDFLDKATYNYGDALNVTLEGGEVLICKFTPDRDVKPATVVSTKAVDAAQVRIEFSEPINAAQAADFTLMAGGKTVCQAQSIKLEADERTLMLTFPQSMNQKGRYSVAFRHVADLNANEANGTSSVFSCNPGGVLTLTGSSSYGISGRGDFSVVFDVTTSAQSGTIVEQPQTLQVGLEGGKVTFGVGALKLSSKASVNDGAKHHVVCCRERNGMLKIYVDGTLQGSLYDKSVINTDLPDGKVTMGKAFKKQCSSVKLYNRALSYKEL